MADDDEEEASAVGAHDGERLGLRSASLQTPGKFHHLNFVTVAPNNDAAFVERWVGVEYRTFMMREHTRSRRD